MEDARSMEKIAEARQMIESISGYKSINRIFTDSKTAIKKLGNLYLRAYIKHPRLTSAITLATTAGVGCFIGNSISPPAFVPQPVNLGFPYIFDPSKWEFYQAWAPAGAVFGGIGGGEGGALALYCVDSKIER